MEPWNKYDDLLTKYLLNECDVSEKQFVLQWINESESNRTYFQSLAHTLKLFEQKEDISKINVEEEWQHFQQLRQENKPGIFGQKDHIKTEEALFLEKNQQGKAHIYRWMAIAAVAASLIFAVLIEAGIFDKHEAVREAIVSTPPAQIKDTLLAIMLHEKNATSTIKTFNLPDGSNTQLFESSELTYREPSERTKREVFLNGRASFKVAKDKTRPFTVFSGDISVTALGTRFTVRAITGEKLILVRLHEGKVVVKSTKTSPVRRMQDVYLDPGQELAYNVTNGTSTVRSFTAKAGKNIKKEEILHDNPVVPTYGHKSWFMFNNQSLNEIFDALADMYNVKIKYSRKDINKMFFIGTFDKSDSVEFILKQIATVNNLQVTKDSDSYSIKKPTVKR